MKQYLPLAVVLAMLVPGCQKPVPVGEVVARVNKSLLMVQDVSELVPSNGQLSASDKEELVKRWVNSEVLCQEARRRGVAKDPKIVKQLRDLEREILANHLVQKEIVEKVKVGEDEARAYFEKHQQEYQDEVKLAQILLPTRADADIICASLKNGADFAKLAREKSIDQATKARGGDLGVYMRRGSGTLPLDFEEQVFALKAGGVSEPIKLSDGFHVIKVAERRPALQQVKFEDIKEELGYGLTLVRQKQAFDDLVEALKKTAQLETHPERIR